MRLVLANVTLTYPDGGGRLTALDDVSLDVGPGEVTALVGPSGSGKSSLLALAATLIRPDRGRVLVDGIDTGDLDRRALSTLRQQKIGIVFQQPNLLPSLTAVEQLQVMRHLGGSPARGAREKAVGLLDSVGMAELSERKPHQLSGGERQRVNITRALMNDPAILLVDEPTSALDHERGAAVMELLARITEERQTATVVVTHDTDLVPSGARVVECRDGRVSDPGEAARSRPANGPAACFPALHGR